MGPTGHGAENVAVDLLGRRQMGHLDVGRQRDGDVVDDPLPPASISGTDGRSAGHVGTAGATNDDAGHSTGSDDDDDVVDDRSVARSVTGSGSTGGVASSTSMLVADTAPATPRNVEPDAARRRSWRA